MEHFDSESDLGMTQVWPSVPPATREAPAAEPGAGPGGGAEGSPSTPSVSPGKDDFSGINDSSSSSSIDDSRTNSDSSISNNSRYLPALVGRPAWDLKVFDELPALQSGPGHERVLRGCPAGVCHEDRGSQERRGGGGRGKPSSSRFTAVRRALGEGA